MQKQSHQYLPETGLVRLPTILAHIQISRTQWLDGVKSGKFPRPIKLGPQTTVWKAEDIHDLIRRLGERAGEVA